MNANGRSEVDSEKLPLFQCNGIEPCRGRHFKLVPSGGVRDFIKQLPVPCSGGMDWAKSPTPFIESMVGQVASVFGRIVLLGSFLDRKRQRYVVPLSGSLCQCAIITDVIRRAHNEYVLSWLDMGLEQKIRDVSMYLESVNERAQGIRNSILEYGADDILPIGGGSCSDHLNSDTKLAVALIQTLAVPEKPNISPFLSGSRSWSRVIEIGRQTLHGFRSLHIRRLN